MRNCKKSVGIKMKVLALILALVALASGKILPKPVFGEYIEGQRFFYMADGNDQIHLVDLEETSDVESKFDAYSDTVLYLYTRNNPTNPDVIRSGDFSAFATSNLDVTKPVKIVVHGWNSDWESAVNDAVTAAFLAVLDVNVIFVDWSDGGSTILYPLAVARVGNVGRFVASAVDWLVAYGVPVSNFHIMGHSLGGHVSGFAGRNVQSGVIPYITAFDPALPLWGSDSSRLTKADAGYVEVIHTNGKYLGIMDAIGHNDFYPNGGVGQAGCLINVACSHSRSYEFFADSLDHTGFMAAQCNSVDDAEAGNCSGARLHMGGASVKPERGIFYLATNSRQPFYQN